MMTSVRFGGIYKLGRFDLDAYVATKGQPQAGLRIMDEKGQPLSHQNSYFAGFERFIQEQPPAERKAMRFFGEQGDWGILTDDARGNHKSQFQHRFEAIRNLFPGSKAFAQLDEEAQDALLQKSREQYLALAQELLDHPHALDGKLVVKKPDDRQNRQFEVIA